MASDKDDAKVTTDEYGRKKWNVEVYEREAKAGGAKNPEKNRVDDRMAIKSDTSNAYLAHRNQLIDKLISSVGKQTLIDPSGVGTFGQNKKFGFVCLVCDLSFRDSLALVDHINSPQHIEKSKFFVKSEEGDGKGEVEMLDEVVRRATVDEVKKTLSVLISEQVAAARQGAKYNGRECLEERIAKRKAFERKLRERRKRRRQRVKRGMSSTRDEDHQEGLEGLLGGPDEIGESMGFSGFGSTKR